MMNKILILTITSLMIFGCKPNASSSSKSNENQIEKNQKYELIFGEWKMKNMSFTKGLEESDFDNKEDHEKYLEEAEKMGKANEFQTFLTFYEDKKLIRNVSGELNTGRFLINNDSLLLFFENDIEVLDMFHLSDKELILKRKGLELKNKSMYLDMVFEKIEK